jgi:ABC-type Fe3+-hydroxamate transport system substrate-binding protein
MGKITIIIKWIKSFKFIDIDKMTAIVSEQNMNNVKEIIPDNIVSIGTQKIEDIDSAGMYSAINVSETEKWAILSTEIMQKQEVIAKLMKQNDEKEDLLKNSKQELEALKNKVQFVKEENENL